MLAIRRIQSSILVKLILRFSLDIAPHFPLKSVWLGSDCYGVSNPLNVISSMEPSHTLGEYSMKLQESTPSTLLKLTSGSFIDYLEDENYENKHRRGQR